MERALSRALAVTCLAAAVSAQTQLFLDYGSNDTDKFGYTVRTVGDVDGDQVPDFAMGSPFFDPPSGVNAGQVRVYSGATGNIIYTIDGFLARDEFGYAIDAAGDVDGDGYADILITRLVGAQSYAGAAYIYSGHTGQILYEKHGKVAYDYFGVDGAGVGDVNGDGFDDFVVGAPGQDHAGVAAGQAEVFSGKDGSVLFTIDGQAADDQFGWFCDRAGDINGDGFADFMISSPRADGPGGINSGEVRVFSGADASVIWTFYGTGAYDQFGWTCSTADDVNGDGVPDIIVGARDHDYMGMVDSGMARVFSGADGSILYTWYGDAAGDKFGWAVRNAGDVDGDGLGDLIVGGHLNDTNGTDAGMARIYSGADGSVISTLYGQTAGDWFGFAVGSAGDVDGDGYGDVIIGATFDDSPTVMSCGSWRVYSFGGAGTPPRSFVRGSGCRGSDGNQPRIDLYGRAALGQGYTAKLRGALPNSIAVLVFGAQWDQPIGPAAPDCVVYPTPLDLKLAMSDANGLSELTPVPQIPSDPALIGAELHHQWVVLDAAANPLGVSGSNDLVVIVGE